MKRILLSLLIGVLSTAILAGLAYVTDRVGLQSLSELLFWQNFVLQSQIPLPNIGTPDHPVYEGTPLNFLAFIASFPLSIIIYGLIAYIFLWYIQHRPRLRN